MTAPTKPDDAKVDRRTAIIVPAVVADAEALMTALAAPDEPAGIRLVEMVDPRFMGLAPGSGHRVAQAYGLQGSAVMVATTRTVRRWVAAFANPEELWRYDRAREVAIAYSGFEVAQIAAHEVGHILVADIDKPLASEAEAEAIRGKALGSLASIPLDREAAAHGPAWAAAVAILHLRAKRHRSSMAELWHKVVIDEGRAYGFDMAAVLELVARVPEDEPLRPLLRDPIFLARIEHAIPPASERAAAIAQIRNIAPPGVPANAVDGAQPHEVSNGQCS
jgi:hypothetical protein